MSLTDVRKKFNDKRTHNTFTAKQLIDLKLADEIL